MKFVRFVQLLRIWPPKQLRQLSLKCLSWSTICRIFLQGNLSWTRRLHSLETFKNLQWNLASVSGIMVIWLCHNIIQQHLSVSATNFSNFDLMLFGGLWTCSINIAWNIWQNFIGLKKLVLKIIGMKNLSLRTHLLFSSFFFSNKKLDFW